MKTNTTTSNRWARFRPFGTFAIQLGLFAGLASPLLFAAEYKGTTSDKNDEEWYDPGNWKDEKKQESPASSDWWDTKDGWQNSYNHAPIIAGRPYYHYYYYWDPMIIRWTTRSDNADESEETQPTQNRQSKRGNNSDRPAWAKTAEFEGTVDGFKKVDLENSAGERDYSTFVRIRLKNGHARVVDLGNHVNLTTLNLKKGDSILVTGRNKHMDGRYVLAADKIKVDGDIYQISKESKGKTTVKGIVRQFSETSMDGAMEKNLLVRIELENGKSCVADLGKGTRMRDLGLQEGSRIRLEGERTKVDGKSLIIARKLSVDGDTTHLRGQQAEPREIAPKQPNPQSPQSQNTVDPSPVPEAGSAPPDASSGTNSAGDGQANPATREESRPEATSPSDGGSGTGESENNATDSPATP